MRSSRSSWEKTAFRLFGSGPTPPPIIPSHQRKIPRVSSVTSTFFNAKEALRLRQGDYEYDEDMSSRSGQLIKKELSETGSTDGEALTRKGLRAVLTKDFWEPQTLLNHLMPRDYKHTCVGTYEKYARTTMLSSMLGTTASVLSTQALLTSVGVSTQSIVPLAATLNWILKDGLGQLGGVIFASTVNTRFDADPKRFRFGADVVLALSVVLESCTVLIPWLFLPLASVANVGKNAAWLSASATRASIHQSFCLEHNLADVTGKAGSQTIAASLAGTALGIGVSPFLDSDALSLILATSAFSLMHLSASYRALHYVQLRNLNIQRTWLALSPALVSYRFGDLTNATNKNKEATGSSSTLSFQQSSLCSLDWDKLDGPEVVAKKERISHFGRWGTQDGRARLASPATSAHHVQDPEPGSGRTGGGLLNFVATAFPVLPYLKSSLHVNPPLDDVKADTLKRMLRICDAFDDQHLIEVVPVNPEQGEFTVRLFYLLEATPADVLAGFLHAALIIRALGRLTRTESIAKDSSEDSFHQLVYDIRDRIRREQADAKFFYGIQDKGWDIKHIFIEERRENRVHLMNRPGKRYHPAAHPHH